MPPNIKKKVVLINPPSEFKTPVLPLGMASVAAYIRERQKDVTIEIIDAWAENLDFSELESKVAQSKADMVGVYMVSPRYDQGKKTIEMCRRALPQTLIVAGGPHPSAVPQETLNEISELDACVIGEGEVTMSELVGALGNKQVFSNIDGLAFRDGKEVKFTKTRKFIAELDALPFPARDLFPLKKYRTHPPYGRRNPYFTVLTSRGCPYNCTYCSKDVFGQNYRARSPQKVCDEIEELISNYGAKEIQFYDDDFTLDMKRAEVICDEIINRGLKFRWSCLTRVNLVDENLLRKMKKAGCWLVAYGVESGNQKILDEVGKGFTVKQVISAFALTKKIGLATIGYFMVGLPGETEKTIQETIALAKTIRPDFTSFGILIVYPGSRLFKLIQAGRYAGKIRKLGRGESLAGTFFGKGNYAVLEDNLTLEQMRSAVKKANREFYLKPRYILHFLGNIRSLSDFKYYLKGALEIIKSLIG